MKNFCRLFLAVFLAIALLLPRYAPAETAPKRIAVAPFTSAARENASLVTGIRVMLASRLAAHGGVEIIDNGRVDAALAGGQDPAALGRTLAADYLITGTVTTIGSGYSLDAKAIPVADPGKASNFYANAASQDEIITAVTQLSKSISEGVFGRPAQAPLSPAAATAQPASSTQPTYQTAHPDRQFRGTTGQGSSFIRPGLNAAGDFSKSQNFAMAIQALDIGDVDGNGEDEIVLADRNKIYLYRRGEGAQLVKVGQTPAFARFAIHALSLADLNGNKKPEIVVSAADGKTPGSFILEWDGREFTRLVEKAPWYLRVMEMPGEGMVLLGQQAGSESAMEDGIYRLQMNGAEITRSASLDIPAGINLFGFTITDLDNDGAREIVAIDQYDRLKVMRTGGTVLWQSDDYFGGTARFVGGRETLRTSNLQDSSSDPEGRVYIPSRIIAQDVNQDGLPEIIVNMNSSSTGRVLQNLKSYTSGEIHALAWNGIGLAEVWRTRKIDGYIAEYQLKPKADKTGAELLVGLVLARGGINFLSARESTVITYQVDFLKQ